MITKLVGSKVRITQITQKPANLRNPAVVICCFVNLSLSKQAQVCLDVEYLEYWRLSWLLFETDTKPCTGPI